MIPRVVSFSLVVLVLAHSAVGRGAAQSAREYEVKAAFVSSVMKFVQWPESAPLSSQKQVRIAVLGSGAGAVVAASLQGATLKGLPIVVHSYDRASDLQACHVLYVAAEAEKELAAALRAVEGRAVLTITEVDAEAPPASVINIVVIDTKLAFQVNLDVADKSGIRLGANLLSLAKRVTGGKSQGSRP